MQSTRYIILRTTPFQESSLILSGLSPEMGRMDFLVKGARSTGKKKFPVIGLFRELEVSFKKPPSSTLYTMSSHELVNSYDGVAFRTDAYLSACSFSSFLLNVSKPMLECAQTYRALNVLLERLSAGSPEKEAVLLAYLAFLDESGLIPEVKTERERKLLENMLDSARGDRGMPELSETYIRQMMKWVDSLIKLNGLQ